VIEPRDAQYEPFARAFEAHATRSAYNAHYDRPAVLALLGDVQGRRVLDLGCGPGLYAEELVARGADVTGVDASPEMVSLARQRLGAEADVRLHDLEDPMSWAADASYDVAVMALVIHHLADRGLALTEIHRVLKPGGVLVVSTTHPTADWLRTGGGYFDRVDLVETWQDDWQVRYWKQPLEAWCAEFADAGFLLERVVEPRPLPSMATDHPEIHEHLSENPGFIAFRLRKS
jgi:SAM-dependent methyltransferase